MKHGSGASKNTKRSVWEQKQMETVKANVYASVKLEDNGEHRGRFKWELSIKETEAIRIVLQQFDAEELQKMKSITLEPVANSKRLPWLEKTRTYDFVSNKQH